ncbi:MAG: glycosyltransferase [Nitrospiraceae bacterium]|nr:glycosyltransferase [Nitrospiraceae bacterium]
MRILWLKTELLHPVDKGGKIRTYQMLKEMKRQHHLTYLTLDEAPEDRASHEQAHEYCHELICVPHRTEDKFTARFYGELALNFVSPLPYFIQKYRSAAMARMLKSVLREQKPDLLVCDFLHPSVNLPDAMPCPSLLFQHNVEAMIWQRHYEEQTNPLKKAYLCNQWKKTQQYEKAACHRFDRVVAVSVDDGETMKREYGLSDVSDIPTGVDTAYFQRNPAISAEPHHLVFTGSMDWLPNEDAILYFAEQILPRIKNILPDIRLTIVGRSPSPRVFQLSRQESGITITGRVEDVRPYMQRAGAYIVPIRIGGGTRLKVYEAMAMEMPVVSTRVGAEGLPVLHGEHLLFADTPEDFATAVIRILTDADLARALGEKASATVRERYGWGNVATKFSLICQDVLREWHEQKEKDGRSWRLDAIA